MPNVITSVRECDECGREWRGHLPSVAEVHIWLCPWCETTQSGRSVVWRPNADNEWTIAYDASHADTQEWPWRGPLKPTPKEQVEG
jgi:ribosomal protein L37AE/L43A